MKKILTLLSLLAISVCAAYAAGATDNPIITFKTNLYELQGEQNSFMFLIGATEPTPIEVDCGNGRVKYTAQVAGLDSSTGALTGTWITCNVTSAATVKIYGDASKIDVFDGEGAYLSEIDLSQCTNLSILNLRHNQLESLDLTANVELNAVYLSDNEFSVASPLKMGANHPHLQLLEMAIVEYVEDSFNIGNYPELLSFVAYSCHGLRQVDATGCPKLRQLSIDSTPVKSLDVSRNTGLLVLNISETHIPSIDLSNNPLLTEFYASRTTVRDNAYKMSSIDLSKNPELQRVNVNSNLLTSIDVTHNPKLTYLSVRHCYLTDIDVSKCPNLLELDIDGNYMSFATLPMPAYETYDYEQRPIPMDAQIKIDSSLDFKDKVLREGTVTTAKMYAFNEASDQARELDATFYDYADGVVNIKRAYTDSVYVVFSNDVFSEWPMRTAKFKIKSAADYGKPSKAVTLGTSLDNGATFTLGLMVGGASAQSPKTVYIDAGDGVQTPYTVSGGLSMSDVTVTKKGSGYVTVYTAEGDALTGLGIEDVALNSIDVTTAPELQELSLVNTGLYSIDLKMNRCLAKLTITGSNMTSIDLTGANGSYGKNILANINLSNNKLTDVTLNDHRCITNLNLSHNALTGMLLKNFDNLVELDLSYNQLTTADLTYMSENGRSINLANNKLSELLLPETNNFASLVIRNNNFDFTNLPMVTNNAGNLYYKYAPQANVPVPTKGPGVNLSNQYTAAAGGTTSYSLYDSEGNALRPGTDYTCDRGRIAFLAPIVGKKVYAGMTNPTFPDFAGADELRTDLMDAADFPTNCIGEFTTPTGGQNVGLSLAAAAASGTALYIDWAGDGKTLDQYILKDTYTRFSATTVAGAHVKVYTYSPDEKITVFSVTGASMSAVDASKMTDVRAFTINNAGLSQDNIKLPQSAALRELSLGGNAITEFDCTKVPDLISLDLANNKLTTFDMSPLTKLQWLNLPKNALTSVTLKGSDIIQIALGDNQLTSVDLSGVPNLPQLSLSGNNLTTLDVSKLDKLIMLHLDRNRFTFSTLPPVRSSYVSYVYGNQQPMEVSCVAGKVDLSSEQTAQGEATTYRWFIGAPVINDEGELAGEELVGNWDEYGITDGVTYFKYDFDGVQCVMTNPAFPSLYLRTNLMNVFYDAAGIADIEDDSQAPVEYYDLRGIRVENPSAGLYIRRQGSQVSKVLIK